MASEQARSKSQFVALCVVLALVGACDETVTHLTLELKLPPPYLKGFKCKKDPRWASQITIQAACDEGRKQASFDVQQGTLTLDGVPLGDCTVDVQATNVFGRTVLSGEADVTLVANQDQTLEIDLLLEPCREPNCDADGDELFNSDEKGLRTDPSRPDTDGDGLFDGAEVAFCCSDPLTFNKAGDCPLRIQQVDPALGPAGTLVKVRATSPLNNPKVLLGGVPLEQPLVNQAEVHGRVAKGAVLGEVFVTSAGSTSPPYQLLFTTLTRAPETLVAMQVLAGVKQGLMQEVVDIAHLGKLLIVLGHAKTPWSPRRPMVLVVDRESNAHQHFALPDMGAPVAMAVGKKRAVALLSDDKGKANLVVLELGTGKLKVARVVALTPPNPVDVVIDPQETGALVLMRDQLVRVPLATSGPGADAVVVKPIPGPGASSAKLACVGLTFHGGLSSVGQGAGVLFLSCNAASALCAKNSNCPQLATVVKYGPLSKCLPANAAGCWAYYQSKGRALGAPSINSKSARVYALTTSGIVDLPANINTGVIKTRVLKPVVQGGWPKELSTPSLIAAATTGHVYTVPASQDRSRMLRTNPANPDSSKRQGQPFVVGEKKEQGLMMALHPDGSVLDVVRRDYDGSQALVSICLRRCSGCVCSN